VRSIVMGVSMTAAIVMGFTELAHASGIVETNSFFVGIAHPLSGVDHILAMVIVGVWSVLAGGRAIWLWPTAFVATMLAGFAAATAGAHIPLVEPAIATSIIVLGLLVALAVRAPVWWGAGVVGLFAFFHGHAHGTEAVAEHLIAYASGFALATATLHAAGITLALLAHSSRSGVVLRAIGALAALAGLTLMAA